MDLKRDKLSESYIEVISSSIVKLLLAAALFIAVPSWAAEIAVIQPGFFAADTQGDFLRARDYAARGATREVQAMYDQDKIFALPENVEVEIVAFDTRSLTCRVGTPRSGKYYWTDIEAVRPGYRRTASLQMDSAKKNMTEEEENREAVERTSVWFLSQPLIHAERVKAMEKYGIGHTNITERFGGTVGTAQSKGYMVDLAKTSNATVIVGIAERTLGKVDYSQIPVDFGKERSWTASLYTPNGILAKQETTTGDIIAFPISAGENDQRKWRLKLENVKDCLEQQIVFGIVVNEPIRLIQR